jgi:phage tail sheath protein FI
MAMYLSPLVDVNEIDLSTTIPAVATSIGVITLRDTWKGPELKRQLVNDVDELIDIFGRPEEANSRNLANKTKHGQSYEDIMAAAGFLQFGSNLYCTRVLAPSATFAGAYGTLSTALSATGVGDTLTAYTSANGYQLTDLDSLDPDDFGDESTTFDAGRPENGSDMAFIAQSRGDWGNYVQIAIVGRDAYNGVRQGTAAATIGLSATLYDDLDQEVDASFDNDKQFLILVKRAKQENLNKSPIPYDVVEVHLVSTDPDEVDDSGANIFVENWINANSNYIRVATTAAFKNKDMSQLGTANYQQLGGGVRSQGTGDTTTDVVLDADIQAALDLYADPESIDVNIFIDSGKSTTIKSYINTICIARADAIGVLDVPKSLVVNNKGNEATDCRDYRFGNHSTYNLNVNSSYVATYANWLEVYDKWNAKHRWIPTSGHVAGIYANTDDVAEAWFAPAGLNRGQINNVRKLGWNPVKGERDILYKNGLNPIVSFPGQGKVVWGQKNMLDKSSAFNRVNVRRLFIIVGKAVSTALKYFLFEPNDTFTRLAIINMIDPFLRDIVARRGIFDYLIVCDERNNSAERIDRNELWCDIYIKPTRTAEFIVLNLIATKTGASFTELVAATTP